MFLFLLYSSSMKFQSTFKLSYRKKQEEDFDIVFTHFDSVGTTFVFSVDEVFSYNVVDRRGIIPPPLLGPTVRLPLAGSYLDVVVRGLAGLDAAAIRE